MDALYAVVVFLIVIAVLLNSINKNIVLLASSFSRGQDSVLSEVQDLKDIISNMSATLDSISNTTDAIDEYALPSISERKRIDQFNADAEIDQMLDANHN